MTDADLRVLAERASAIDLRIPAKRKDGSVIEGVWLIEEVEPQTIIDLLDRLEKAETCAYDLLRAREALDMAISAIKRVETELYSSEQADFDAYDGLEQEVTIALISRIRAALHGDE